jgi:YggT family protein
VSGLAIAIGRVEVADYVGTLVTVYAILIIARIVLSYFTRIPYNRALSAVIGFVTEVTDPYLNVFRRLIPPIRLGAIALDITPIIALLVLFAAGQLAVAAILAVG